MLGQVSPATRAAPDVVSAKKDLEHLALRTGSQPSVVHRAYPLGMLLLISQAGFLSRLARHSSSASATTSRQAGTHIATKNRHPRLIPWGKNAPDPASKARSSALSAFNPPWLQSPPLEAAPVHKTLSKEHVGSWCQVHQCLRRRACPR